jgi:hypothetical protein
MRITQLLNSYQSILNVSFSPPNFVINLPTVDLQLHLIQTRTLDEPGFVLDIVPWCPEYESYNLPWIINRGGRGIHLR